MIQCNNCGQVNNQESNFCRFCGTKMTQFPPNQFAPQPQPNTSNGRSNFEYAPPRPHVWKTDEFPASEDKTQQTPRKSAENLRDFEAKTYQSPHPQPLTQYQQNNMAYGYRCPRCATQLLPKVERKISTAGWLVFAALLVTIFPLFWIGLLIKENIRTCSVCGLRID